MKLLKAEHECRPMRIHELVPDFVLEDVWALPTQGGPDEFPDLLDLTRSFDPTKTESTPARFLWSLRDQLGRWLGLGEISTPAGEEGAGEASSPAAAETSLRHRLPPDLVGTASDFTFGSLPFVPLYRTDREAAAEVSNKTVHGVAHLAWVDLGDGCFEGRMAVYVKPRGVFGKAYMAAIKPFRYWVVYPALMRQMARGLGGAGEPFSRLGRGCRATGLIVLGSSNEPRLPKGATWVTTCPERFATGRRLSPYCSPLSRR